jgi:hypothetical protein
MEATSTRTQSARLVWHPCDSPRGRDARLRTIAFSLALPAGTKTAKAVVPTVGALDHPPPWPATNTANERRLASSSDVGLYTSIECLQFGVIVVVAFVEADVLGQDRPEHSADGNRVQRCAHHPLVVDVRPGQGERQGNSTTVGQNVAFRAEFSTIGRIRARDVPPLGAFTEALSSEAHCRSSPTFSW